MEKTDSIEKFLDKRLIKSNSTRRNYRMNIQTYFKHLDKSIDTYFKSGYSLEKIDNDLRKVYRLEQEKGRPELSMRTFFNSIKQFMVTNDKKLKDLEFWDILKARTKGADPASDEAILNASDIKEILMHGNACTRAMFLMLASSGRRISEILALLPEDVHPDDNVPWINIKKSLKSETTKSRQKTAHCFISFEAAEAYKAWMKERDEYINVKNKRAMSSNKKDIDSRVFPMSYGNALIMWGNLLMRANRVEFNRVRSKWTGKQIKKIKRKEKGQRLLEHPHCLRKFYRSYLGDSDLAEYLMGHSTMLTRSYRKMKPEDLAEKYLAVMQNVTIFETKPDLTEHTEKITKLESDNEKLKDELAEIKAELLQLRVEKLEKANGIKK